MLVAAGMNEEDARSAYVKNVTQSESDWLLCDACVREAKSKRDVPAVERGREAVDKSSDDSPEAAVARMYRLQEEAIRERDERLWPFFAGFNEAVWLMREQNLGDSYAATPDLKRYMLSSSFIAAGFNIEGNKRQRNEITNSFTTLASAVGYDFEESFFQHLECEKKWVALLRRMDYFHGPSVPWFSCALVVGGLGLTLLVWYFLG